MKKEIFRREGVFVEYEEKKVELDGRSDELIHRKETPTRLWWELKEAIKGKRVRIVVYELDGGEE
ncbi:hypothetical protein [Thermococcus sp.]